MLLKQHHKQKMKREREKLATGTYTAQKQEEKKRRAEELTFSPSQCNSCRRGGKIFGELKLT